MCRYHKISYTMNYLLFDVRMGRRRLHPKNRHPASHRRVRDMVLRRRGSPALLLPPRPPLMPASLRRRSNRYPRRDRIALPQPHPSGKCGVPSAHRHRLIRARPLSAYFVYPLIRDCSSHSSHSAGRRFFLRSLRQPLARTAICLSSTFPSPHPRLTTRLFPLLYSPVRSKSDERRP